jgi:hypothetical protein
MTSKSHIPEAIVGSMGLGMAAWLIKNVFPINSTITSEAFRSTVNTASMEYYTLDLVSVLCIMAAVAFLMVGIYFTSIVIEDLARALWKRYVINNLPFGSVGARGAAGTRGVGSERLERDH